MFLSLMLEIQVRKLKKTQLVWASIEDSDLRNLEFVAPIVSCSSHLLDFPVQIRPN